MRRWILIVAMVLACGWTVGLDRDASASSRREYREAIRSLPLLERPNRFGHFYGNTVRRIYYRRHGYLPQPEMPLDNSSETPAAPAPTPSVHQSK
ncbi:MAG: hypothetical protein H5U08_17535 [Thermogutta sp.]|uniref:hypothetical protein n=1 Tax=Thermogutta sp. TaxID=1962930 RepID=UPI0019A4F881|nr:hypothetical protein [Thermogutta sp.]MBC7354161.1 hypothetical protein [Thermogutta sp.]